jgi:hypothetical protein
MHDDKWQFRLAELGYSLKSFGCMLNMACDCPTGFIVSAQFGDTATIGVKVNLQRALLVDLTEEVQMEGSMIHNYSCFNTYI